MKYPLRLLRARRLQISFRGLVVFLIVLPQSSLAADFYYSKVNRYVGGTYRWEYIVMEGEIRAGDAEKFRRFLLADTDRAINARKMYLSSPGGDVSEAIAIAKVLRKTFLPVGVSRRTTCLSACFLIYVGAVERLPEPNTIGVHRAFFAGSVARNAELSELDSAQRKLRSEVAAYLTEMEVPAAIQDRMYRHSSRDVVWLNQGELESIGYYAAFWEEALVSRCGFSPRLHREFMRAKGEAEMNRYLDRLQAAIECGQNAADEEREKFLQQLKQNVQR